MKFCFTLPAIRGVQSNEVFYSLICPLDILSRLFTFYSDEIPEEFRAQRVMNEKRIPEITNYILSNPNSYVFSSITASIDGEHTFKPIDPNNQEIGVLEISMDSRLLINDGQHRKAAIDEALKENPSLKNESISVVLFVDRDLKKSQQMFSDLNRHAVKVSNSLSITYNHRDPKLIFIREYLDSNAKLSAFIDRSNDTLAQKSNKLFTLSNFVTAVENSFNKDFDSMDDDQSDFVVNYWNFLTDNFKEWSFVLNKEISPYNARKTSVAVYGVVLEALGKFGNYLYEEDVNNWKDLTLKLNEINWNKSNQNDWLNRCMLETGNVHKSSKFISRTFYRIKELVGLPLTPSETKAEMLFRKEN